MQSTDRHHHSTEAAVLKIVSDILCSTDSGDVTFLCRLNISAAFNTVDHDILVESLEKALGIRGQVLEWIKSFLYTNTQTAALNGKQSTRSDLQCGVPQGCVLGQIIFLLYTVDVIQIATHQGLSANSYADDA